MDRLTAYCEHCGKPLPENATVRRRYCDERCYSASVIALSSQALREAKAKRRCQHCGGPMPVDRKHAKFCCERCQITAGRERAKAKRGPGQDRARKPKPCEHCGAMFKGRPGQRFCGKPCTTAARWAAGTMRLPSPLPERNPRTVPVLRQEDDPGSL